MHNNVFTTPFYTATEVFGQYFGQFFSFSYFRNACGEGRL